MKRYANTFTGKLGSQWNLTMTYVKSYESVNCKEIAKLVAYFIFHEFLLTCHKHLKKIYTEKKKTNLNFISKCAQA